MTEFTIQECMRRLNIQSNNRMDKMRDLYCNLDTLINAERPYITSCMFEKSFEKAENVERDVWRGVLLRSLKMAMESDLGGAIKQENEHYDKIMSSVGFKKGVSGYICWAACPDSDYSFVIPVTLTKNEQKETLEAFEKGKNNCFEVMGIFHKNIVDNRRQFEFECELMDLDRISISAASSFRRGIDMNLEIAENDGDIANKIEKEYLDYKKMSMAERQKDFDHFVNEIRYVNGLLPRPIVRDQDDNFNENDHQRG